MNIIINGRFAAQPVTGVQRVAYEITHAIDRLLASPCRRGIRVRLLVPQGADTSGFALSNVHLEKAAGGSGHLWEQFVLPRHVGEDTLLCLGNSAPVTSLLRRAPVVVMLHDQAYRLFPRDYSFSYRLGHGLIERLILNRAATVLSVSESERQVLLGSNSVRSPIVVAANGSWVNDGRRPLRHRGAPGCGFGLYVGSFSERKNVRAVFAVALRLARERGCGFRFVGPPNAMSAAMQASIPGDLRHLIAFDGYVADADLQNLYHHADFLMYPSLYEASGLPPSEAMTLGCPVILSDIPVMRERCGDAALYCDPFDHDAILAAACRILDDPALAQALSRRGYARAATFTWEKQALTILDALRGAPAEVPALQPSSAEAA